MIKIHPFNIHEVTNYSTLVWAMQGCEMISIPLFSSIPAVVRNKRRGQQESSQGKKHDVNITNIQNVSS